MSKLLNYDKKQCFTFYKGVRNLSELKEYMINLGDMPECEMFQKKSKGDGRLIKGAGYIADETCDEEIFNELPKTLRECLGQ